MKTQITFYTSLLGKCPISSELKKIFMQICPAGEEISEVGHRPLAAKKGVRGVEVCSLLSANARQQRMCLVRFFCFNPKHMDE